ncbi:CoA transferase [Rhodobacterales bacterium HKCCE2091]|nr:CoA transferase [Rhodobacterales bacterium HKCCE2091]
MTEPSRLPLSGLRVLDLGRFVAAPFAAQLMGDLGAEVIKIERPGTGDDIRAYGPPFLMTTEGKVESSYDYVAMNRNKKSVCINFTTPEGAALVKELAASSDVLIENFRAGHLKRYGLGFEDIHAVAPDLVYCSISGFGQSGPYAHRPALDSIFQAMSGHMSISGEADGPATKSGVYISDLSGGLYSAFAILAAVRHREVNEGGGQHLDMSLLSTSISLLTAHGQKYLATGNVPFRMGARTPGNAPSGTYRCADGEFILSCGSDSQFATLTRLLGDPDKASDPRFATRAERVVNYDALSDWMGSVFVTRPRAEWIKLFISNGLMAAPINTLDETFDDPHVRQSGMTVSVDHPNAGPTTILANPIRMSATPIRSYASPPALGQHTSDVLRSVLGKCDEEIASLRAAGAVQDRHSD